MSNRTITRQIGNLRGFSTDSIFLRPSNVADKALNIQKAPDNSLQIRRGYQAQIANIGGLGCGTLDDPALNAIRTLCIGTDGFLYNKLTKQIFLSYDGTVTGSITNVTNPSADLTQITSVAHGLATGAEILISGVGGAVELNDPSSQPYTITYVDADNFILDGVLFSSLSAYTTGGEWSISFASNRYLTISIYVDPDYIYTISDQSINFKVIETPSAQVNGNQSNTNTIVVDYGHSFSPTNNALFNDSLGRTQEREVLATTPTSIIINGDPVTVTDNALISNVYDIPFGKGFDVLSTYDIIDFITDITDPSTGLYGLKIDVNGDTDYPAAFLQLIESEIIASGGTYTIDYWYWEQVNFTVNPPLPGSANTEYQNSPLFENASMATFEDVIYIANGWDNVQKFDGQTVYRAGMPKAPRPTASDNTTFVSLPFVTNDAYQYAISYEQVDNRGHIVEGEISQIWPHTVSAANAAINVIATNLQSSTGNNWNTNGAVASGGAATVYGPDVDGYYYNFVTVTAGYTLNIGDTAYYADTTCAVFSGAQTNAVVLNVNAGHGVEVGDVVYFIDSGSVERVRTVTEVSSTSITIGNTSDPTGTAVSIDPTISTTYANVLVYKQSLVLGNIAIVNGTQSLVNTINVLASHTIAISDIVSFTDTSGNVQRRNVTATAAGTITVDGNPISVTDLYLITAEDQAATTITLRRTNANAATLGTSAPISNNLRINIYRTEEGKLFGVDGDLFLVASIPNNSDGTVTQTYIDGIPDTDLGRTYDDPDRLPNPPPICKYLKSFGNQLFFAGGERGKNENSDRVFFSEGNNPEYVPLATNFFAVPNVDDDITGIGVSGSTIVTTKGRSLWAATGNFLTGQIDVVQIAPGTNIGCVAHATIASVGGLMYFLHTNGVYAITENQLFPTDAFGNPIPITLTITKIFRETNYLPYTRFVLKRAVGVNYTKDNLYLLFLPCEDIQTPVRSANNYSILLAYDYEDKDWFMWDNINAAGGFLIIDDDLYWQERRYSRVDGVTGNLYKQHRFYRLIDHADHAGAQTAEWISSWEDMGQPEVRKKFCRAILLMDRVSDLYQFNLPSITFSSYKDRIPNLQDTISVITQTDNVRNSGWSVSPWSWGSWAGYQDSFITVNLKQGTTAKSMQIGLRITGINFDMRLAGFQLEIINENRKTVVR